jgi:hypothetical protein
MVCNLQPNSAAPILTRYLSREERQALQCNIPDEIDDPIYDTSDKESGVSDDDTEKDESDEEEWDEDRRRFNDDYSPAMIGDEEAAEFGRLEAEGDAVKEDADILERRLLCLLAAVREIKGYPSSHRHLREIPSLRGNVNILLDWAERRQDVQNARILPTTFGSKRRGNVYVDVDE